MSKVGVLQFEHERDAMKVINGMDTDELEMRRNEVAGQYVVYPTTESGEGTLRTFAMIEEDFEVSDVDEKYLVKPEDFDESMVK